MKRKEISKDIYNDFKLKKPFGHHGLNTYFSIVVVNANVINIGEPETFTQHAKYLPIANTGLKKWKVSNINVHHPSNYIPVTVNLKTIHSNAT